MSSGSNPSSFGVSLQSFIANEQLRVGLLPKKLQYLSYYFNLQIKFVEVGNSHTISHDCTPPAVELPIP